MRLLTTIADMQQATLALRQTGATLGFVPTMGALHAGHLSLVRAAKQANNHVVASIFVNPLQFAPGEDLDRYPRTFDEDRALLEQAGVDLLFAPAAEEMYLPAAATCVEVSGIGDRLDGATRPGHFRGVATVVAKLFHITSPTHAYFGQKDAAQVAVLRAMVRDLAFPVELVVCPTVRDPDGLALSSRNRYLTPTQRAQAPVLYAALLATQALYDGGEQNPTTLKSHLVQSLEIGCPTLAKLGWAEAPQPSTPIRLDYAEIVHPDTLLPVTDLTEGALLAVALHLGQTRLIDNLLLPPTSTH